MAFEDMNDIEPDVEEAGPPPEETSNRPFLIVAGILGGIMLLSLLCMAAFAFMRLPGLQNSKATENALAIEQSTAMAISVRQTADAQVQPPAATPTTEPTATEAPPTPTLVVAQPATNTPTASPDPRTATVAALLTQAAIAGQTTPTVVHPTALPDSGFADDVGIPGLFAMALLLVGVIFFARRMRTAH